MIKVKDLTIWADLGRHTIGLRHPAISEPRFLDAKLDHLPSVAPGEPTFWDAWGDWIATHYDEIIERVFPETLAWMPQDEFVKSGGSCPVCRNPGDLEWDDEAANFDTNIKECWCNNCGASFRAHYALTGYSSVVEDNNVDNDE